MGVRLSTWYSRLAGTNEPLHIGLTSVTAGRRLRIRNREIDAGGGPAGQASVAVALAAAVDPIVVVTVNAAELIRDVRTAVMACRSTGSRRPRGDRHADHPPKRPLTVKRCGKRGLYPVGRRRFELRLRPPEGRRIPSYPTGPQFQLWTRNRLTVPDRKSDHRVAVLTCDYPLKTARNRPYPDSDARP